MAQRSNKKKREPDDDGLARLIAELGRAAQAGWGPTTRWLTFLVVIAITLAVLALLSR
ncbi:MAG: hypothetical protein J2P25_23075 [Nocardiopsaceae bacterium]|nr:hypothetical protein [Nocardiopsaceae bacterium]